MYDVVPAIYGIFDQCITDTDEETLAIVGCIPFTVGV
jgi:hypothetical protein